MRRQGEEGERRVKRIALLRGSLRLEREDGCEEKRRVEGKREI